jgi:hypothetical protein
MFNWPVLANKPAVNNKESPGKKGIATNPVSIKITKNKTT